MITKAQAEDLLPSFCIFLLKGYSDAYDFWSILTVKEGLSGQAMVST
ncbi:hypothetical protein wVul_1487 [Wolbachia endosymbiont of Armadillidium vulgare str. wVulC]|nr:hypothetical protein wVul_1487 [Wolbachia endosymbiont of Armadillidium vulgare str. wVulC]